MHKHFIDTARLQFQYYKNLGERTFAQLSDDQLLAQLGQESNSISIIVNHLHGNMLSRWTDFLSSDGEKEWRNRDGEFSDSIRTRKDLNDAWAEGWSTLFTALDEAYNADPATLIYIRNQGHTIVEAITRQLCHYSYHIGQIVHIGTALAGKEWKSLSIPKGKSKDYNKETFSYGKRKEHFTKGLLK